MIGSRIGDGWRIFSYLGVYRFLLDWDARPEERAKLVSRSDAEAALRAGVGASTPRAALDHMHAALSYLNHSWLGRQQSPLEEVLEAVRSGRLVALREEPRPAGAYVQKKEEPWEAPPPEPVKVTVTMELRFVYDQADKGVGSLEFKVRTADGKEQRLKTDGKGVLRLRNIEPGYVDVWTELEEAHLETTVTMRAEGDAPTPGGLPDFETKDPAKQLLQVAALRVHDEETLKSIAEDCDIPWQKLAQFNFGTDDEEKLLQLIPGVTGCRGAKALDERVLPVRVREV